MVNVQVDESKLRRIADIYARTQVAALTDAATPGALPAPPIIEIEPVEPERVSKP